MGRIICPQSMPDRVEPRLVLRDVVRALLSRIFGNAMLGGGEESRSRGRLTRIGSDAIE
jgi:hypothetical protein